MSAHGFAGFDVAIVGAGPAGCWAAYLLSTAGARVVVIDGSHPREKPCGGGITARALHALQQLPEAWQPQGVSISSTRFDAGGRAAEWSLGGSTPSRPALMVAARRDFDARLLGAALDRGTAHVAERVTQVERHRRGWRLSTRSGRVTAAWLIGADGVNGIVRRRVWRPFARHQLSIASGHYVRGRTTDRIDITFTHAPPGYLWSFPRADHLAVGICGQATETSSTALLDAAAAWIHAHTGVPGDDLIRYSWPIPSLGEVDIRQSPLADDGWFLVGDAAGLVDPITREGIYFALESARLAADSLLRDRPCARYAAAVRHGIHAELIKAARMKERFFQPRFGALLVRALQQSEGIRRIMSGLIAGTQTYDRLRRRLLLTGEWRLAADYLLGRT